MDDKMNKNRSKIKKKREPKKYLPGKAKHTHFKSEEAYRKYVAYLHIHNIPHARASTVWIAGKKHKVECHLCKKVK